MPQMDTRPPSPWRRTAEILRWRGLWVTVLLGVRKILRPILYWHVYRIFATDIAKQIPEPYAKDKIETKIHVRRCPNLELDKPLAEVAAMGEISREEAEKRLHRGDALAMAYASGEPAGYGWISFSSGVVELDFGVSGSCTRVSGALRQFRASQVAWARDSEFDQYSSKRIRARPWRLRHLRLD